MSAAARHAPDDCGGRQDHGRKQQSATDFRDVVVAVTGRVEVARMCSCSSGGQGKEGEGGN